MDIRMWSGGNRWPVAHSLASRLCDPLSESSVPLQCLVVVGVLAEARELVVVRGLLGALSLNLVWTLPQHWWDKIRSSVQVVTKLSIPLSVAFLDENRLLVFFALLFNIPQC